MCVARLVCCARFVVWLWLCVFLFGFTALTGWSYYGEQSLEYIFGPKVVVPYRWTYCALIVLGATSKVDIVWSWGDLMNSLQIFPNLIGILGLSGVAAKIVQDHRRDRSAEL